MQLAIFWSEIMHYHTARIAALCQLAEAQKDTVYAFALRLGAPDLPLPGYHELLDNRISVLSNDSAKAGLNSALSQTQSTAFLSRNMPDVVAIAGYSTPVALSILNWCRRHHRGAVLMSESQAGDYRRTSAKEWIKRRLIASFDAALVGGSPHVAYALELGLPAERVFTGYDAVDNDFWAEWAARVYSDAVGWRRRLNLSEQFFVTASRLVPKKNVAGLLRAYAHYVQQTSTPAWPLLIVGDGPLRSQLEQLAAQLNLQGLVRFTGYLAANDMAPIYALASAFILASSHSEQWGLVVNEAMAAGTPVLVSQICGSAADLVVDGETGFKFDPASEEALVRLLVGCSEGRFDLKCMGHAAQQRVARFHPEVFAENCFSAARAAIVHANDRQFAPWDRITLVTMLQLLRLTPAKLE